MLLKTQLSSKKNLKIMAALGMFFLSCSPVITMNEEKNEIKQDNLKNVRLILNQPTVIKDQNNREMILTLLQNSTEGSFQSQQSILHPEDKLPWTGDLKITASQIPSLSNNINLEGIQNPPQMLHKKTKTFSFSVEGLSFEDFVKTINEDAPYLHAFFEKIEQGNRLCIKATDENYTVGVDASGIQLLPNQQGLPPQNFFPLNVMMQNQQTKKRMAILVEMNFDKQSVSIEGIHIHSHK
jgi:hypothetical protein